MTTLPDHPALILTIAATLAYLWLTVLNPFVFGATDRLEVAAVPMAINHSKAATIDIEPAPFWD